MHGLDGAMATAVAFGFFGAPDKREGEKEMSAAQGNSRGSPLRQGT